MTDAEKIVSLSEALGTLANDAWVLDHTEPREKCALCKASKRALEVLNSIAPKASRK